MEEYKFKTTPYAHQREAFVLSAEKKVYALLMDMGTGKTKVCLDTIGHLFEKQEIDFSIIVAPKGVIANWLGEIETDLPERIEREVVLWRPALTKKFRETLKELSTPSPGQMKFLLMNVESFSSKKGIGVAEYFIKNFKVFKVHSI